MSLRRQGGQILGNMVKGGQHQMTTFESLINQGKEWLKAQGGHLVKLHIWKVNQKSNVNDHRR